MSEDKRTRKADAQFNMRLGEVSPWESDDDRYLHAYSQTSEEDITEEESDDEEYLNYLFFYQSMMRTILYSLVSLLLDLSTINAFLKNRALQFCWRCSKMADECFNVAHKMREYY